MSPLAAILVVAGTTGLVAYLVNRRARSAAASTDVSQTERQSSGD
jgi:hypothetical protein